MIFFISLPKKVDMEAIEKKQQGKKIKKGRAISCWINPKNEKLLLKKYGALPSSKQILYVLLTEELKTTQENQEKKENKKDNYIYHLKKIGNNLNQIAKTLNENSHKNVDHLLLPTLQLLNNQLKEAR